MGGLFLGFPAIFPSAATLLEKHEKEKKEQAGIQRTMQGRRVAAVEAMGAAMGSIGLIGFGIVVWKLFPIAKTDIVLMTATALWFVLSVLVWFMRRARGLRKQSRHSREVGQEQFERRS